MRGDDERSEGFFSYVRLETRIPTDHPMRAIRPPYRGRLTRLGEASEARRPDAAPG
jgi:hypothetical protein